MQVKMITYLLVRFGVINDTWEPHQVWYFFAFDLLVEVFVLDMVVYAIRASLGI